MATPSLGLGPTDWELLLGLLDNCSKEQLDLVRGILAAEKEKAVQEMVEPAVATSDGKAAQLAKEIWNQMKGPENPAAEELPDETLARIVGFAQRVRNQTLDEIAGAVDRAYSKFTETVVADIRKQKE